VIAAMAMNLDPIEHVLTPIHHPRHMAELPGHGHCEDQKQQVSAGAARLVALRGHRERHERAPRDGPRSIAGGGGSRSGDRAGAAGWIQNRPYRCPPTRAQKAASPLKLPLL